MATVLISSAASAANASGFPVLSAALQVGNRAFGKQIDNSLQSQLFGENEKFTSGRRLNSLFLQSSTYGDAIPVIYGKARIAGNIIWAKPFREQVKNETTKSGGKGGSKSSRNTYSYYATFAIALCEGEINKVLQIWADSKLINLQDYCLSYRIYNGSETQLPDSAMQANLGIDKTPAYRGLAYIVIEELALEEFGNRLPNFNFEVERRLKLKLNDSLALEEKITAVNIIPGSGEFVYDTKIQNKVFGQLVGSNWVQRGFYESINQNSYQNKADSLVAIDDLLEICPNLEWVSLVVTWFGSSLDVSLTSIAPRVEYKNAITSPDQWQVKNFVRDTALEVSRDANNNPLYGGTPSDSSVLNLIQALKDKGIKVLFYPLIFMDLAGKPWRGKITGNHTAINNFFTKIDGYNQFILHYANLVKNKVDAFIIGSELKGITSIKTPSNQFPAVTELVNLAGQVKTIMGASTKISYAADWSEYHSVDGYYNLDPLWASSNIDFVGIDAYFPLTDEPQIAFDKQKIISGWTSEEGYDWYYSDANRTIKTPLQPQYAWKNIAWWWGNVHINPNSLQTAWIPNSKKIWFTEFGFASLDGTSNQPNIFYDLESVDGGMPRFSNGNSDFLIQRIALEATLDKWANSSMIEQKFIWTYDARPYPFFPNLNSVWSDGKNWEKGHWINGKIGLSGLSAILLDICKKMGIIESSIDVTGINEVVSGYLTDNRFTGISAINELKKAYFFDSVISGNKIKFVSRKNKQISAEISKEEIINGGELLVELKDTAEKINEVNFSYLSLQKNYQVENASAIRSSDYQKAIVSKKIDLPIILDSNQARTIAEINLYLQELEQKKFSFSLPLKYLNLEVNDLIKITEINNFIIRIASIFFGEDGLLKITGVGDSLDIYNLSSNLSSTNTEVETINLVAPTSFEILDLPLVSNDNQNYIYFATSPIGKNWNGCAIFESLDNINFSQIASNNIISTQGKAVNALTNALPQIIDEKNSVEIALLYGELSSISSLELFNYGNLAIIGNEIIQFMNAELLSNGNYKLTKLIRGCFGTENEILNHTAGEKFVLLSNLVKIPASLNYLGVKKYYKCLSFGGDETNLVSKEFTYLANCLKPFSPVLFKAKSVGLDVEFSWVRRSRLGANLKDYFEISLDEPQEIYELDIFLNSIFKKTYRINSINSFLYANSMQLVDLGFAINLTSNNNVMLKIYQISNQLGRGTPLIINL